MREYYVENNLILLLVIGRQNEMEKDLIDNAITTVRDWDYCYKSLTFNGIGSLAYVILKNKKQFALIPEQILLKLGQIYLKTLSRNIIFYEHFKIISRAFLANNIDIIPLKGIYLAEFYYNEIAMRQMSDIDILVKEEDSIKCVQILKDLGYSVIERVKSEFIKKKFSSKHLPTMELNGVSVEIHYRVFIDESNNLINIDEYWTNSRPCYLEEIPFKALSPENHLQYLCIHLERHFNEGKIKLYQFIDMIQILRKHEKDFDWDFFVNSCEKNKCIKNVFTMLSLLERYFCLSFPANIQQLTTKNADSKTEKLFISFLQNSTKEISNLKGIQNIKNLRKIKGPQNQLRYLLGDLFPSFTFMKNRYKIRSFPAILVFYILRIITGITLLIKHLGNFFR
jgi:hypothetical protein